MNIEDLENKFKYKEFENINWFSNINVYKSININDFELIEHFKNEIFWYQLSYCRVLDFSKEFIEKFKDKVDWFCILKKIQFDEDELEKYFNYYNYCLANVVLVYQNLSLNFLKNHFPYDTYGALANLKRNKIINKNIIKEFEKYRKIYLYGDHK